MLQRDVIVIHETNGRKYLEALSFLERSGRIRSLEFYEASVIWKLAHGVMRERRPLGSAVRQAFRNLRFRITSSRLRGTTIVICLPPWDFRFPFYARLRRHNRVVYNTSWPHWMNGRVPRRAGFAEPWLRRLWVEILRDRQVTLTAVTQPAAAELTSLAGREASVIPHVVSEELFMRRASFRVPFRLLFVGELVESRGLATLADVIKLLADDHIMLDIVGDGPMRRVASQLTAATGGTWYGRVTDRATFAGILASAQLLVSPSIRTRRWEELFGMALVEAMACGVPCIASDHVGPRSIVEHGVSGVLVPEQSPRAIAEWVRRLMSDEPAWERISQAAIERAQRSRLVEIAARWEAVFAAQ